MKKVIIFTNSDHHFYAHLLPIALEAKKRGHEVKILTRTSNHQALIEESGLSVMHLDLHRGNLHPLIEIKSLFQLIKILKLEKPDILHNFTIKPILYGSITGCILKIPKIINTFLGMGLVFISNKLLMRFLKKIICLILGSIDKSINLKFITQNQDDAKLLFDLKIAKQQNIVTQCSVGIPTEDYDLLTQPESKIIFALVARMLIDKGVHEFVSAAKILKDKNIEAEFWLIGSPDKENKQSLDFKELENFNKLGYVKYLGYEKNIKKIWEKAHVAVLPSYREGLSRSLLEAGAYGRAVITTDAPGGRELVKDLENGLLVKSKDAKSLASAMESLIQNSQLKKKLAKKLRSDILIHYDSKILASKMVNFYDN